MRGSAAGLTLGISIALAIGGSPFPSQAESPQVYFSPRGGCTEAVVHEIESANSTVYVQAYSFTSAPIAKALVDAQERGVHVEAILDKSNRKAHYSAADYLVHHGVPTRIDAAHAIAHNKVMVIDEKVVITGSFNFTAAAEEHNAENLLILRDPMLAARYLQNWKLHALHSALYRSDVSAGEVRAPTVDFTNAGRQ